MSAEPPALKPPRVAASLLGSVLRLVAPNHDKILEGFVDRMIGEEAFGWAFDPRRPNRRVLVVARLDNRVVAEALADLPRRDLENSGKGDGRCGFRLRMPNGLDPAERERLRIEAVIGNRRRALKRAKRFREEVAAPAAKTSEAEAAAALMVGYLERCVGGVVRGWAVDPNNPETPPTVDLFEGERYLGSVKAEVERPRLREGGAPFGARGFEFQLPDPTIAPEVVRARIAQTRFDLRRSRAYPGDAAQKPQNEPAAVLRPGTAAPQQRPARIGLLIIGPGAPADVQTTLAAWRGQDGDDLAAAVISMSPVQFAGVQGFCPGDEARLRGWIRKCGAVVMLSPGQVPRPGLARAVEQAPLAADVIAWPADGQPPLDPNADLAFQLGAPCPGLAVSGAALLGRPPPLDLLAERGLGGVLANAGAMGWSWATLPEPLVEGPPPAPPPWPESSVRRVTFAVWTGWSELPPKALAALLAAAQGWDVEVLAPPEAHDVVRGLRAPAARSLAVRLVEAPTERGQAALLAVLGRAATGQVVVFCHGDVEPERTAVVDSVRWAAQPGVGAVTVELHAGDQALLGLDRLQDGSIAAGRTHARADRPVSAAPAAFLAVSRLALAEADGFDPDRPMAEVDLAARMAAAGRRSVALGSRRAAAPTTVVSGWLETRLALDPAGP